MIEKTICQVLHGMTVGGAEVLADRLARQLSDRYRFVFACLDEEGELGTALRGDGFAVHVLGRRSGLDWRCARSLARFLRAEKVDLIHAHQYTPFFYTLGARFFGGSVPILFCEHGRFHPDYPRRKRMLFNRLMLRRDDRVVAVGEGVRQALIDNEGIPAQRVEVIYNGVHLAPFRERTGARASVRGELGLRDDEFVVAQVARLDYLKDHLTAVRTIERLVGQGASVKLLLVGEGPERAAIESEIERMKIGERIMLLGTRKDVPAILSAADACLLTSISEGIPLALIEGMAAGLPIVSTDVGGVSEVVEHGTTALLAPAGGDRELAEALLKLENDAELRARMGEDGERRAEEVFSEEAMHAGYVCVYEQMMSCERPERVEATAL